MQTIYKIYFELLFDIPLALLLFRISENRQDKPVSCYTKLMYCLILFCISYFLNASLFSVILCFITLPLIYSLYVFPKNYRIALRNFFEFVIFYFMIYIIIVIVYTLIFNDQDITIISQQYNTYKSAIINLLTYIIYALTSNLLQINITKSIYILFFNAIVISISVILGYTTLSLNLWDSGSTVLPIIFATIFVLIIICISLYNKFLSIIEENTNYRFKLELDKMEQVYSAQLDDKLNQLHSLRHDMKNHLIVIDGYASQHNDRKIHEYIHNISEDLSLTNAVDSGSHIVSALIAEKENKAKSQNIRCEINISTPGINIDDFSITTIIGNLFDNAIKAASECEHGWIRFSLTQTGSYMNIVIENSCSGNIIENNGEFTSTKNDKVLPHGIGIKNVRKVVSNLNGQIDFSYASGYFSVKAELPNYS
ncbi:sensor histidine kinase [Agathobacter sp.]